MHPLFLPPAPLPTARTGKLSLHHIRVSRPSTKLSNDHRSTLSMRAGDPKKVHPLRVAPLALLALLLPNRAQATPHHLMDLTASAQHAASATPGTHATFNAPSHAVHVIKKCPTVATAMAPNPSLRDRLSFYLAEYLMWNPGAKVLSLFAVTLLCMYLGSFLYRLADPEKAEAQSPFWHSVRAIANPLEDDWQKNSLRTTSIMLAAIGMVVFAILVGMVTESVETAVANADGEMARVVVSDHILVCGWGKHVSQILKDVNQVSTKTKVVVLAAPEEKEAVFSEIRSALTEEQRRNLRVFYRPGVPIIEDDLARVAASRASKILLVNPRRGDRVDADRLILSRALALRQNLPTFNGDIVAELNSVRDEAILRSILGDTKARSVETVNAEQLLFRFMAQAIRQPGLADVVAQLMGDDPANVFHVLPAKVAAPGLVGTNVADLRPTSVPGSVLCGMFDDSGVVQIATGGSFEGTAPTIAPETNLLLLGTAQKTGMPKKNVTVTRGAATMMSSFNLAVEKRLRPAPESFLVCGWRTDMEDMLRELDSVLAPGSKITILDLDTPDSVALGLKNLSVTTIKQRADRYENLEALLNSKAKPYDNVVLLGSAIGDDAEARSRSGREEDTKTLASLVYVNELLEKQRDELGGKKGSPKTTMVTVEFINERVASMAKEQNNIANAILPQNLSAKIAAQTVRDNRLNAVWRELLSQEGREVYIRPTAVYEDLAGTRVSFANMIDRLAREKDDIVIGYISKDGNVVINPQGDEKFRAREWDSHDMLVVLSEE